MLASSGGMERLRAAEKVAKEKRLCLYANTPSAAAPSKTNGSTNGQSRVFDGTVVRIWTGDQITVVEKDTGKERRLQLSSTRGPRYACILPRYPLTLMTLFWAGLLTLNKRPMQTKLESFCAKS